MVLRNVSWVEEKGQWYTPSTTWIPAFAADKVAAAGPVHAVGAAGTVRVSDLRASICPETVVIALQWY